MIYLSIFARTRMSIVRDDDRSGALSLPVKPLSCGVSLCILKTLSCNRCEVPHRGWSRVSAMANRHQVLADSLDDGLATRQLRNRQ